MNTDSQTTKTSNLEAIAKAASYADKREIVHEILEENTMIERLARGVMAALIASPWLDESDISCAYSEIRGEIKDSIMDKIMMIDLQDLAAIERVSRTWRAAQDAQAAEVQTPRKHQTIADLKDIVDFIERAEGEPLEAFRRFVEEYQRAQGARALTIEEKYGIATGRAVMADEGLVDVLDHEERLLIAKHRATRVYDNVMAGLRPDGTPDTDSDTDIDTDTAADVEPAIVRKFYPDTYSKFADVIEGFITGAYIERAEMLAMMTRFAEEAATLTPPDTDTAAE